MADATVLGIHPPATVRIRDRGGWSHDWPHHCVEITGEEIVISVPVTQGRRRVLFYPYEHADRAEASTDDFPCEVWYFHGSETFVVSPGPPQPASSN